MKYELRRWLGVRRPHFPRWLPNSRISEICLSTICRRCDPGKTQLAKFKEGDEKAFAEIYKRYERPIHRFVRTRVSDPETASELTQEIFLKAFRFRESYQEKYALSTWLWTIARNTASDHLRGARVSAESRASSGTSGAGGRKERGSPGSPLSVEEIPCPKKGAELLLIKKDQRRSLFGMLKSLSRMQKRVIWFQVVHQLSYDEIATKLDITVAAVKNLSYRAKRCLQSMQSVTAV